MNVQEMERPGSQVFEQLRRRDRHQVEVKQKREKKKQRAQEKKSRRHRNWVQEEEEGGADAMYGSKGHELPRQAAVVVAPSAGLADGGVAGEPVDDPLVGLTSDPETSDEDAGPECMDAPGILEMIVDPATMPLVSGYGAEASSDESDESDNNYDSDRPLITLRK
jgi:hypothetical protein